MAAAFAPGNDVTNVVTYEIKLASGSLLPLAVGLAFFIRAQRSRRSRAGVRSGRACVDDATVRWPHPAARRGGLSLPG